MDKRYSPLDIEEKWANIWKDNPLPNIKSDSKFFINVELFFIHYYLSTNK